MTPGPAHLLVVDTSIAGVAMGIVRAGDGAGTEPVWRGAHLQAAGSIVAISGLLREGLAACGLPPDGIDGLCVSHGPGSFTGIKIGLAFAYGLVTAWPRPLPVLGVSALEAATRALHAELGGAGPVHLLLPATRTHGFLGTSRGDGVAMSALTDAEPGGSLDALIAGLPPSARLHVCGAWPMAVARLQAAGRSAVETAPSIVSEAAVRGMSETAARAWPKGFGAELPLPRYLRLSTAEEKLAAARTPP